MAIWGRPSSLSTPLGRSEGTAGDDPRREYLWNTPDGHKPDFSEAYTDGDEILISWNALNNSIYDLWLTSWSIEPDLVALCLARAVNLTHDGSIKLMTSDPPSSPLANTTQYALRFKPPTGPDGAFIPSSPDITSPGFLLQRSIPLHQQDTTTSSSSSSVSSASPSGSGFRTTPSRDVVSTPAVSEGSSEGRPDSDMSPAAAAGLTIGLILVVAALVAMEVAYLVVWRRKRRREGQGGRGQTPRGVRWPLSSSRRRMRRVGSGERGMFVPVDGENLKTEMVIDDTLWMMSPELPGDSTWGERLVHELQGSRLGRGGVGRALTVNSEVVELEAGSGPVRGRGQ
ncbi:hypothetical protein C8A05DRAFT_36170 [Staphylotrichum tortipilum]|uniref:Uncharacterized protein n=1 Tax=Staphylotrichum tortipilum TaxID=2831512 RepID=A0AAN6MHE3_9PEZI|nr:hypothetical protein C8A05DRAFT_36170 [Staphylotrichum longicolle]